MTGKYVFLIPIIFIYGCSSVYLTDMRILIESQKINDLRTVFQDTCKSLKRYDDVRADVVRDNIIIIGCALESETYADRRSNYFSLFILEGGASIRWGIGNPSQFGTTLGHSTFPKLYCLEYFEIVDKIEIHFMIDKDQRLEKECYEYREPKQLTKKVSRLES